MNIPVELREERTRFEIAEVPSKRIFFARSYDWSRDVQNTWKAYIFFYFAVSTNPTNLISSERVYQKFRLILRTKNRIQLKTLRENRSRILQSAILKTDCHPINLLSFHGISPPTAYTLTQQRFFVQNRAAL